MKSTCSKAVLTVLVLILMGAAGCNHEECESKHYVDIYINEVCDPVTLENDEEIDVLFVYPGDYVIFNNMRAAKSVTIEFPPGMFELDEVEIEAGHRAILQVIADGPLEDDPADPSDDRLTIRGDGCPSGNPQAKVGEGP